MSKTTKTAVVPFELLKKAANLNDNMKQEILAHVPDLFDADGWWIDLTDVNNQAAVRGLSEVIGEPPAVVSAQNTRLIEPLLKRGRGNENGHGLYLHLRGGMVNWYAQRTKKEKAVCIVPVAAGSSAEQELVSLGYTKL